MARPSLYKFKINEKIGDKLCYSLFDAVDQATGQQVFLKVLNERLVHNEQAVYNFLSNARILKLIENPSISKIHQFGSDQGHYYIASEPIDLEPISSLIQDDFSLSFEDLIEIYIRLGRTLRYAHLNGLVHGHLNPNNIYIKADGSIKIDDLGFSWYVPNILRYSNEESLYLAQYIAPDFYENSSGVDGRADIYSLGIILVQMLTGSAPFTGDSITSIQDKHKGGKLPDLHLFEHELPEELETIVAKCVALKPDNRYHNLKQYVGTLERLKQKVFQTADVTVDTYGEEEILSYQPYDAGQFFTEEEVRPRRKKKAMTLPKPTGKLLGRVTSVVMSRNFVLATFTLLIITAFAFIGSNELPIPFLGGGESDTEASDTEQSMASMTQSPGFFEENTEPEFIEEDLNAFLDSSSADLDSLSLLMASSENDENSDEAINPGVNSENMTTPEPEPDKTTEPKSTQPPATKTKKATDASAKPEPSNKRTTKSKSPVEAPKTAVSTKTKKEDKPQPSKSASAKFRVTSKKKPLEEAFVFIDDEFKGRTDKNGRLEIKSLKPNQSYTARVTKKGYTTVARRFTASENSSVLSFDIKSKMEIFGTLILDPQPKADSILVDDKLYRGNPPLKLTLPWGEHRVRFVNKSLNKSWEKVVNLKVGQVLRVKHNFVKAEFGKVAVSLKNASEFGFAYVYVDGKLWDGKPNTTPVEISLPVGSHTIEIRRKGFSSVPRDIIVEVKKGETKYVAFTLMKNQ